MQIQSILSQIRSHPFFSLRKEARENIRFSLFQTSIILVIFAIFLGVYYVVMSNIRSTQGFVYSDIMNERQVLLDETMQFQAKIGKNVALNHVQNTHVYARMQDVYKSEEQTAEILVINEDPNFVVNIDGTGL